MSIAVAKGDWKQRHYNYTMSLRNQRHKNNTPSSNFLSELKKSTKETPKLTWSVLKVVPGYSNFCKGCFRCLNEKLLISTYPDWKQLLNKRYELTAQCQHENKFHLAKQITKKLILYIHIFPRKHLPEDRINMKLKVVNFSRCYFHYINCYSSVFNIERFIKDTWRFVFVFYIYI